jgi:hypothetical protein
LRIWQSVTSGGATMMNEHVIIIALALLIFWLAFGGKAGMVAAFLSVVMIVGALRHPEIALSKPQVGTQEETLHATMLLVALILVPPMLWLSLRRLFRRGGQ